MKKKSPFQGERRWDAAALDELIDEFTVEADGEDERILAFLQGIGEARCPTLRRFRHRRAGLSGQVRLSGEPVARADREVPPRGWAASMR